jgi:signal transduction histidine kinase
MTLVNRVSAFFLIAMAVTLACFSMLLYGLVNRTLNQQFDAQLRAAQNTLVAAIEVESDDVKWEPSDHTISVGSEEGVEETRWAVIDERGRLIDHSKNASESDRADLLKIYRESDVSRGRHPDWHFSQHFSKAPAPKPPGERDEREFAELTVVVARSVTEMESNMRKLGFIVLGLSLGTLLIAAVGGRWYCYKALRPVQNMVNRARSATTADFQVRLPVTDQKDELAELGAAFNKLLDDLQVAYERQQRFTGDAAHQLRTPLTVLQGQIDVALRRPRSSEEYCRTLELLREQSMEMHQVVEGLLFLARAEGEGAIPPFEEGDLDAWIEQYAGRWQSHSRWSDLTLKLQPGCRVATSWPLLSQLFDNLVVNAFKYSSQDTPVTVSVHSIADGVALDVEDQGRGISPQDQKELFTPFFRAESVRQSGIPGTGLGLPIAARIAAALNGRLECTSELGKGSRFRLILPAAPSQRRSQAGRPRLAAT